MSKENKFPVIEDIECGNLFLKRNKFLGIPRSETKVKVYAGSNEVYVGFSFRIDIRDLEKTKVKDTISLLNALRKNDENWRLSSTGMKHKVRYDLTFYWGDFIDQRIYGRISVKTEYIRLRIDIPHIFWDTYQKNLKEMENQNEVIRNE